MSDTPTKLRPAARVSGLSGYVPAPRPAFVKLHLAGTERPIPAASDAFSVPAHAVTQYPDASGLLSRLAQRCGVQESRLLLTAGADEAIDRACRAFVDPGQRVITTAPTFEMIAHFAKLAGGIVETVPWAEGPLPRDALIAAGRGAAMLVVVTPNNPTGTAASREDIAALAEALPQTLILVDAAYGEFVDAATALGEVGRENVIHLRTLSKAMGAPGLRVGYTVGSAEVIDRLRAAGGPYSVSHPSLVLASAWLEAQGPASATYVDTIQKERKALADHLRACGCAVEPSQANFVLARSPTSDWLTDGLLGLGMTVRRFRAEPCLDDAVRITCPGDGDAFKTLLNGLSAVLKPKALIFDLDGVLADVATSYRDAIVQTAQSYGVEVSGQEIQAAKLAGDANNDWVLTKRLLAHRGVEASLEDVTARFEDFYQGVDGVPGFHTRETLLGSRAWLEKLAARYPLAIVTGRPRGDAERFLRDHGIAQCFASVVCMEDAALKPDPAPVALALKQLGVSAAWMMGDTPDDIVAARGAGVVPVGILPPGDDPDAVDAGLRASGAARVLSSVTDLEEFLP